MPDKTVAVSLTILTCRLVAAVIFLGIAFEVAAKAVNYYIGAAP